VAGTSPTKLASTDRGTWQENRKESKVSTFYEKKKKRNEGGKVKAEEAKAKFNAHGRIRTYAPCETRT
jgi:hypothetical protein